jgi:hypothetical protein
MRTGTHDITLEHVLGAPAAAARGGPAYHEINRFTAIDRPGHLAFKSTLTMPDGAKLDREVE